MLMLSLGIPAQNQVAYLLLFLGAAIIANVPISLGGLGPRELVSLLGAHELGLSGDTAVAISLLFYFVTMAVSFAGVYYAVHPEALAKGEEKKS
jgi:uncharacterized membrane protein YbhN (UPF0104 family)